jgi:hypothetical protein
VPTPFFTPKATLPEESWVSGQVRVLGTTENDLLMLVHFPRYFFIRAVTNKYFSYQ